MIDYWPSHVRLLTVYVCLLFNSEKAVFCHSGNGQERAVPVPLCSLAYSTKPLNPIIWNMNVKDQCHLCRSINLHTAKHVPTYERISLNWFCFMCTQTSPRITVFRLLYSARNFSISRIYNQYFTLNVCCLWSLNKKNFLSKISGSYRASIKFADFWVIASRIWWQQTRLKRR